jgi:hypothetical protein
MSAPVAPRDKPVQAITHSITAEQSHLRELLSHLDANMPHDDGWLTAGMAIHDATGGSAEGKELWREWSAGGSAYKEGSPEIDTKWRSFGKDNTAGGQLVTLRSLEFLAREAGWKEDISLYFEDVSESAEVGTFNGRELALPNFERRKSDGVIAPSTDNLLMALQRSDICGLNVSFDEFSADMMCQEHSLIAEGETCATTGWRKFKDPDYTAIKRRLEGKGRAFATIPRAELKECVHYMAWEQSIDSAQLWLSEAVGAWDGVPRVETFCSTYWGAADSEYTRAVGRYIWSAFAGRVLDPGCQADMAPILVGDQGEMKTSSITGLLPSRDLFCEISFHESDDDLARKLRGVLIAEIPELKGLNSRDAESIKAFVTRRDEKWIPKYKEFATSYKRRAVLIGTTNDEEFLADPTGNRRWLPMNVGDRAGGEIDVPALERDRDMLWAEARERFAGRVEGAEGGIDWKDAELLAKDEHAAFIITHPWEHKIVEWLDTCGDVVKVELPEGGWAVSNTAIYTGALDLGGRMTGYDGRNIGQIMTKLGFTKYRNKTLRGWKAP